MYWIVLRGFENFGCIIRAFGL